MRRIGIFLAATFIAVLSLLVILQGQTRPPRNEHSPDRMKELAVSGAGKTIVLRSPEVADGGQLPKDYTGDGTASTLPLEWRGAPKETRSFAVIMHHIPKGGEVKWYWVLYNIPAEVTSLPKNVKGVGTLGNNSINGKTEYAPPHSKGPGPKLYTYTVYALSAPPKIAVSPYEVSRKVLLDAMKGLVLDSAELRVIYTRPDEGRK